MNTINYFFKSYKECTSSYSEGLVSLFTRITDVIRSAITTIHQINFGVKRNRKNAKKIAAVIQLQKDFPCMSIQEIKNIFTECINNESFGMDNVTLDKKFNATILALQKDIKNTIKNLGGRLENDRDAIAANRNIKKFLLNEIVGKNYKSFNLSEVFLHYFETHPDCTYAIRFLSRIHQNRMNEPLWIRSFLDTTVASLAAIVNKNRVIKPSVAMRDTLRTPTEVMADLLTSLQDISPNDAYKGVEKQIKSLFLTHSTSIDQVRNFLQKIQSDFPNSELASKCSLLESQLINEPIFTRLNDNIYGRVFDSAFVMELVNNPPSEVVIAMNTMSQGIADYLEKLPLDNQQHSDIANRIGFTLMNSDPRFWFPGIDKVKKLQNDRKLDKFVGLIEYLRTQKMTGHECISVIYLVNKIAIILESYNMPPPWMQKSTNYYRAYIAPHIWPARHIRQFQEGFINTRGLGITTLYQPAINDESWMVPSQRPCTVHRPIFRNIQKSLNTQLQQGIPWGCGVSGSASMALYAWEYFNKEYAIIDSKSALLSIIMFLCYDGGHSIHETLWTANLLKPSLLLDGNFGINAESPEEFISDYEMFTSMYEGTLKEAFEKAFDKVIQYYKIHSFYQ